MVNELGKKAYHFWCGTCQKQVWKVSVVNEKYLRCDKCREIMGPVNMAWTLIDKVEEK